MHTQKFLFVGGLVFSFIITFLGAHPKPDWTFAIYMEAGTPDMHYWIHKNMNDMALAKADHKKLNIVTQVHIENLESWRYLVRKNVIKPLENIILSDNCGQRIVDFVQWTVKNYPAKHYGLICWGHGFGILDPSLRPTSTDPFAMDVVPDEPGHECQGGVCPLKRPDLLIEDHFQHRVVSCHGCQGFMFNSLPGHVTRGFMFDDKQAFVNNAMMIATLKTIKEEILKGKKLDVFGTDCCKMAMLEVGYQAKDFVTYLVGSQNCELKDGWNYKDFFSCFDEGQLDSLAVVQAIVKAYGMYYEKNTIQNTYSLSALDLNQLNPLVANFNGIVAVLKKLLAENKPIAKAAVLNARLQSPSMCQASYYLDLGSVYANLLEELGKADLSNITTETVTLLKQLLSQGQDLIKAAVVANATGTAVKNLQGISIYFPRNRIDESYLATPFAQETTWLEFLRKMVE